MTMRYFALLLAGAALGVLVFASLTLAQTNSTQTSEQQPAPNRAPTEPPTLSGQGNEGSSTLEIAPQPGAVPRKPNVNVVPGGRSFRPGESTQSVNPEFAPSLKTGTHPEFQRPHAKPYLGITVKYTTLCFLGKEEDGLEIMKVDPNSPAARAGLHGPSSQGGAAAALQTLGGLLGPAQLLVAPLTKKSWEASRGDMIVAIDDHRVRTQQQLEDRLAQLKPGDTTYITVLRPLPSGGHQTLKLAVHLGRYGQPVANSAPTNVPPGGTE